MRLFSNYWRLLRLSMALFAGASVAIGFLLSTRGGSLKTLVACILVVICITSAAFGLNALTDVDRDQINDPGRPIPSGKVSIANTHVLVAGLFLIGLTLTLWIPLRVTVIGAAVVLMLMFYRRIKNKSSLSANILTALMSGLCFILGGLIGTSIGVSWYPALLVLPRIVAREIAKDVEDIKGDKATGNTTLPMKLSAGKIRAIITALCYATVALALIPLFIRVFKPCYGILILPAIATIIMSTLTLPGKGTKIFLPMARLAMGLGIAAMLISSSY